MDTTADNPDIKISEKLIDSIFTKSVEDILIKKIHHRFNLEEFYKINYNRDFKEDLEKYGLDEKNLEKLKIDYELVNLVLCYKLTIGDEPVIIDKDKIREHIKDDPQFEVLQRKFSGLIIKYTVDSVKLTFLMFRAGKVIVVGLKEKSSEKFKEITTLIFKIFKGSNALSKPYEEKLLIPEIVNMVYTFKIPFFINIEDLLNDKYWPYIRYDPELFPGCNIKFPDVDQTYMVYSTNKTTITGCKKSGFLKTACKFLIIILESKAKTYEEFIETLKEWSSEEPL